MSQVEKIACVTGGTGMVGKRIVELLLNADYRVRLYTRQHKVSDSRIEYFQGDLCDEKRLAEFFSGSQWVFHCAAELYDESSMWDVNVEATKSIIKLCKAQKVTYFCYLSSAGVIGKTHESLVFEHSACAPMDTYERSKLAAEQLVLEGVDSASVLILRPTNVVDESRPGALLFGINRSLKNRVKIFLKGGENAHLVHAEDVARAAMHFIDSQFEQPECFFVSCDHQEYNTFSGIWRLGYPEASKALILAHLPIYIPYLIRRLFRGVTNLGNVRYSSSRLMKHGFNYRHNVADMVGDIIRNSRNK